MPTAPSGAIFMGMAGAGRNPALPAYTGKHAIHCPASVRRRLPAVPAAQPVRHCAGPGSRKMLVHGCLHCVRVAGHTAFVRARAALHLRCLRRHGCCSPFGAGTRWPEPSGHSEVTVGLICTPGPGAGCFTRAQCCAAPVLHRHQAVALDCASPPNLHPFAFFLFFVSLLPPCANFWE